MAAPSTITSIRTVYAEGKLILLANDLIRTPHYLRLEMDKMAVALFFAKATPFISEDRS
jgi:hypothetical protein